MEEYRKSAHATYRCEYHFVWVPKYRYQVLVHEVKSRLKEILIELCEWLDVSIIEGAKWLFILLSPNNAHHLIRSFAGAAGKIVSAGGMETDLISQAREWTVEPLHLTFWSTDQKSHRLPNSIEGAEIRVTWL